MMETGLELFTRGDIESKGGDSDKSEEIIENHVGYETIAEFKKCMEKTKPRRLLTFFNAGFFGIGSSWVASFVDDDGIGHYFCTTDVEDGEKFKALIAPIYKHVKKAGIEEVDGMFRVSKRDSTIYQIFTTDAPEDEERMADSYTAWIKAVKELPAEETVIQHANNMSGGAYIDAVHKSTHLVTSLDGENGRTLEDTIKLLQRLSTTDDGTELSGNGYKFQDNNPVVSWYHDMKNE